MSAKSAHPTMDRYPSVGAPWTSHVALQFALMGEMGKGNSIISLPHGRTSTEPTCSSADEIR